MPPTANALTHPAGPSPMRRGTALLVLLALALLAASCSIKRMAARSVANALTSGADVMATDEDPELIRDALPFGLKTLDALMLTLPDHQGLLLAACRGYAQYAYAFVLVDAERLESTDYARAEEARQRALRLFLRARDYGLRGLELRHKGIGGRLSTHPDSAVRALVKRDVPMLYWTAAAWGLAVSIGKDRPEILVDLAAVRALLQRGLELDERYEGGSLHEAMVVLEALPPAMGGSPERARRHFQRAVELSGGKRASPYVTLAQSVSVARQDRAEFQRSLQEALAVDPNGDPNQRLANILLQRKARWLLDRGDELFLDSAADTLKLEETR